MIGTGTSCCADCLVISQLFKKHKRVPIAAHYMTIGIGAADVSDPIPLAGFSLFTTRTLIDPRDGWVGCAALDQPILLVFDSETADQWTFKRVPAFDGSTAPRYEVTAKVSKTPVLDREQVSIQGQPLEFSTLHIIDEIEARHPDGSLLKLELLNFAANPDLNKENFQLFVVGSESTCGCDPREQNPTLISALAFLDDLVLDAPVPCRFLNRVLTVGSNVAATILAAPGLLPPAASKFVSQLTTSVSGVVVRPRFARFFAARCDIVNFDRETIATTYIGFRVDGYFVVLSSLSAVNSLQLGGSGQYSRERPQVARVDAANPDPALLGFGTPVAKCVFGDVLPLDLEIIREIGDLSDLFEDFGEECVDPPRRIRGFRNPCERECDCTGVQIEAIIG